MMWVIKHFDPDVYWRGGPPPSDEWRGDIRQAVHFFSETEADHRLESLMVSRHTEPPGAYRVVEYTPIIHEHGS